jgi:hypothetical protein
MLVSILGVGGEGEVNIINVFNVRGHEWELR